ncbi:MAG TPA: amidohydrolase family protein, partial [Ilumatobacteraceae bacterium]|nr:amidohydrolase family protein [Ilumatobacteraceae bacterium]
MTSWLHITRGSVIDGSGAPPRPDTDVLVRDDQIVAIGTSLATEQFVPRGEPLVVLDAFGKTVMPGLIDTHCHVTFGESLTQEEQDFYTGAEIATLRAANNLTRILRSGVTSIAQPGGSYNIGVALRQGRSEGIVAGPRIATSGRFIAVPNALTDFYPTWVGQPPSAQSITVNTVDELRGEIRAQVKNGADFIKLCDSAGGQLQAFTAEELKAGVEIAHQLHRPVTIHARGAAEVKASVRAGVDWIMHGNILDHEA